MFRSMNTPSVPAASARLSNRTVAKKAGVYFLATQGGWRALSGTSAAAGGFKRKRRGDWSDSESEYEPSGSEPDDEDDAVGASAGAGRGAGGAGGAGAGRGAGGAGGASGAGGGRVDGVSHPAKRRNTEEEASIVSDALMRQFYGDVLSHSRDVERWLDRRIVPPRGTWDSFPFGDASAVYYNKSKLRAEGVVAFNHKRHYPWESMRTVTKSWANTTGEANVVFPHAKLYRRFHPNEVAAMMSFGKDHFDTSSSLKEQMAMLGNAVAPQMSKAVFSAVRDVIDGAVTNKTTLEICAGCGGLSLGMKRAMPDFRPLSVMEYEPWMIPTLQKVHDAHRDAVKCVDVRTVSWETYRGRVGVFTGGPPCQPYSTSGKKMGADSAIDLMHHVPSWVSRMQPEVVVLENVPNITTDAFRDTLGALETMADYSTAHGSLRARDFGVDSTRKRWFFVAIRNDLGRRAAAVFERLPDYKIAPAPTRVEDVLIPWDSEGLVWRRYEHKLMR